MHSKNTEIANEKFKIIKSNIDNTINNNKHQWLCNYTNEETNEIEILIKAIEQKYKDPRNWLYSYVCAEGM